MGRVSQNCSTRSRTSGCSCDRRRSCLLSMLSLISHFFPLRSFSSCIDYDVYYHNSQTYTHTRTGQSKNEHAHIILLVQQSMLLLGIILLGYCRGIHRWCTYWDKGKQIETGNLTQGSRCMLKKVASRSFARYVTFKSSSPGSKTAVASIPNIEV